MSSSRDRWIDGGWRGGRGSGRGSWGGSRGSWHGGRGNSMGGRRGSGRGFQRPLEPQNWTLGPPLENIELSQLLLGEEAPTISSVRYAASYSWFDSDNAVVAVPGKAIHYLRVYMESFS